MLLGPPWTTGVMTAFTLPLFPLDEYLCGIMIEIIWPWFGHMCWISKMFPIS
jgi:hypothetical protein